MILLLTSLWQRRGRRKPTLDFAAALLLYTLTIALVPPWVGASELLEGSDETVLYTGGIAGLGLGELDLGNAQGLDGVGIGGAQLDWAGQKRSAFTREEENGVVRAQNINWGDSWIHHLSASQIFGGDTATSAELKKREDDGFAELDDRQVRGNKTVHLTFNTCLQPIWNSSDTSTAPPPLQLFFSNSSSNKSPGPNVQGKVQYVVGVDEGYARFDIVTSGDLWVGVYASAMPSAEKDQWLSNPPWNYELALSTENYYHGYETKQFLYLVDTDDSTALFITGNMTDHSSEFGGVDEDPANLKNQSFTPYTMYAQNRNVPSRFKGLGKSYCAVRQLANITPGSTDVSLTTRGLGNFPKQQFYLKQLNRSSNYHAYLARPRTSIGTTAGILWEPLVANTKTDGNCQIIYNLPFCSEVAYAVPSNPTLFDAKQLMEFYDNGAQQWWANFTYSLQQVQCNTTSSRAYSLARDCDDCAAAYKTWLCAVTIPRCMDYSANFPYLAARSSNLLFWNASANGWQKHPWMPVLDDQEVSQWQQSGGWLGTGNNQSVVPSRNSAIDSTVKPGAYKEIRPCKDLCWTLVQSCPSPMGFGCPGEGSWAKEVAYGERDVEGDVTCSYLGAVYFLSGTTPQMAMSLRWLWGLVLMAGWWAGR
ncbi:stretch-activated Ca2+-permeable channel component-domain-containing protein [Sphaerosporella brunnea]|uniref:Stretch-activated Ca2+-permeable channel component-domain-containing protein n=1 Tax=Sphaerosporella brunnea TaxID=1250544 RepID=A0A5J5ES03_9PEZI|nr:stretch-activated Ca2+-permeable channel component-domain-containing protein [Sphaerosporella brunnea]